MESRSASTSGLLRRAVAAFLAMVMCLSILPVQVMAEELQEKPEIQPAAQGEQPEVLKTADGEVQVEEDWNETFPYGTFAFPNYQADIGEPGAKTKEGEQLPGTLEIPVYRLGGTTGVVTAWVLFTPAATTDASGEEFVYDYAASPIEDVRIEYQNPNPLAAFQTPGMPAWRRDMQPGTAEVCILEQGELTEDGVLTIGLEGTVQAERYLWQAAQDGIWQDLEENAATGGPSVEANCSLLWDFDQDTWSGRDLRCIYFADGQAYCSQSLLGEVYEPIPQPEPMPEDLDPEADPGYTEVKADEVYGLYRFPLTFADGETVKYIRVTALDDEIAELPELALFTITDCEGGDLSGACNTLTLMISDNDESGESTIRFAAGEIRANRKAQSVKVPVKREGDKSYNVTVRYETVDGTARAGVDYAKAEGALTFVGSLDEIEIPIELIANRDTEDKYFSVRLSQLQGGGEAQLCRLETREITVTLHGSAAISEDGAGQNLATLLSGSDGEELAEKVTLEDSALLADNREPLQALSLMVPEPALEAELVLQSDDRSHRLEGKYKFQRGENYSDELWKDWEILVGTEGAGDCANTDQNLEYENHWAYDKTYDDFYDYESDVYHYAGVSSRRGQYTGCLTDSNWGFWQMWGIYNDSVFKGAAGNYFSAYKVDVEWEQIGFQTTGGGYTYHRYLRPVVSVNGGNPIYFYTEGDRTDKYPSTQTVRVFTNGNGGFDEQRGSAWFNEDPENLMRANPLSFGENRLDLLIEQMHHYAWNQGTADSHLATMNHERPSHVDVRRFQARRRVFNKTGEGIDLVIYTANDSDETGAAYTALDSASQLYKYLTPEVSLVNNCAGVTVDGDLYVGSELQVTVKDYKGYTVPVGGLFLANSKGEKVGDVIPGDNNGTGNGTWIIRMIWNGMGEADLNETYSLHVIYNQIQTITIDVTPSMPSIGGADDFFKSYSAFSGMFTAAGNHNFTATYVKPSSALNENGETAFGEIGTVEWGLNAFDSNCPGEWTFAWETPIPQNLQSINFYQNHEDKIVLNGRTYNGDDEIILTESDRKESNLVFFYYHRDYLYASSPMKAIIGELELFYDGSYDGDPNSGTLGINGTFDKNGFFIPAEGDVRVNAVKGAYSDAVFKPQVDDNGVVHQYYLRVNYVMRPRAFHPPLGTTEPGKAQILPAFYSAVTDEEAIKNLTEEQRGYRWIAADNTDDKPMYGGEAAKPSYIDIPLGGDISEVTMESLTYYIYDEPEPDSNGNIIRESRLQDSYTETTYHWEPDFVGRLLVPFRNPTAIYDDNNITGGRVPIAGENVRDDENGVYPFSTEGLRKLNGYLGSFVGCTGFAVGVQEQQKPASGITSVLEIRPETLSIGDLTTMPSPDNLNNLRGEDMEETAGGRAPGDEIDRDEFAPDIGVELPDLSFAFGDNLTFSMEGYQIALTLGIPLIKREAKAYSKSFASETSNGTTSYTWYTDDGAEHTKSTHGKATTESTTTFTTDPQDQNKRVARTVSETVDENGRKTTETKETPQIKRGNQWINDPNSPSRTVSNSPNTPANSSGHGYSLNDFGKDIYNANGSWDTIGGFFKALGTKNTNTHPEAKKNALKDWWKGMFKDNSLENAKSGRSRFQGVEVSAAVQLAIVFEYNPIDNRHYFKMAGITASVSVQITSQIRLACCPLFYGYLKFGAEVTLGASLGVYRVAVEGDPIRDFVLGSPDEFRSGKAKSFVFKLDMREDGLGARGFHMDLYGTVSMSVFDNPQLSGHALTAGQLTGNGAQKEVILEPYNKEVYVCLDARGSVKPDITNLVPVLRAESKTVFNGFEITPGLSFEVGGGVGVEVLKAEIYLRTSIAITMTMGQYVESLDQYEGFFISDFEWNIALGFHASALFLNFEMDLLAFGVQGGQEGTGGYFTWNISASAFNGIQPIWSKTTYTTPDAKHLDGPPPEPYGVNLFRDMNGITFYNSDGSVTDTSDKAGSGQGWNFRQQVSASTWWGGAFNGEFPLNNDLAKAAKDGAYVVFKTDNKKIDIYFDGEITINDSSTGRTARYTDSPAKLDFGNPTTATTVTIVASKGAQLDRYCVPTNRTPQSSAVIPLSSDDSSLVRVSGPTDISTRQRVNTPRKNSRAIDPTATDDFQLSGYSSSGDAKKLVGGLATGYSYQLAEAGDNTYIVYPLMLSGAPQLVLSRIVMTGDLNETGAGLVHPLDPENTTGYLLLDNDGFTDLDFSVRGDDSGLTISWVSYSNAQGSAYSVKRRTVSLSGDAGTPAVLTNSDSFRYQTALEGEMSLWVEASGSGDAENDLFKAWLLAKYREQGLTEQMLNEISVSDPALANPVYYWASQSKLNELYGSGTTLRAGNGKTARVSGQVENLETAKIDETIYVLYTTAESAYFDTRPETPVTVDLSGVNADTEHGVIRRLWLRTLDSGGFGEAKLLQTAIDFDGCSEDNYKDSKLKDGLYAGSARVQDKADPYYANLNFVRADMDGTGVQTMALFEMGGNSYLISETDLKAVTADGSAALKPVFTETTGTEVSFGSDGKNLACVFTAPVADSLCNAIYVAWWDNRIQEWGAPTILAMRHLQIYEDRIAYEMDSDESKQAYLGNAETPAGNKGSKDQFTFSNLQMAVRTLLNEDDAPSTQLLVLTEGSFTALKDVSFPFEDGKRFDTLAPASDAQVGFYAIAFGEGKQALGEGCLSLARADFSMGSELVGTVNFTNTGTVAIRASDAEPMTIKLLGGGQTVATWHLTTSIPSGKTVHLNFEGLPLTSTLSAGSVFSLVVQENEAFAAGAFSAILPNLLEVEERPELSFGSFSLNYNTLVQDSDKQTVALLDFNATVLNNGSGDANEVFIQFSYDTGEKDADGAEIYKPINITGSTLTSSPQESIPNYNRQPVREDYANGVYRLRDANGSTNLDQGCYRSVSGILRVPASCFAELENFSGLHLRAEIYSNFDDPDLRYGVYTSDHGEYNGMNNAAEATVKHVTKFQMPDRISMAIGNTVHLPVSYLSTSRNPNIVLSEVSDGSEDWVPYMGVCYYDAESEVLIAAPNWNALLVVQENKTATGVLQVEDKATNSVCAIVYKVGDLWDGVNIYKDDASFTFYNADGKPTDVDASNNANKGWLFVTSGVDVIWNQVEPGRLPMNDDFIQANQDGAYFTFETVAQKIRFVFQGEITVSSSLSDVETTLTDGSYVEFDNPDRLKHTVTVRAKKGTIIDRYIAIFTYGDIPDADPASPQILWNRSFPETASVQTGQEVPMTCYLLDASGLQSVSFNGQPLSQSTTPKLIRVDDNLWSFEYTFTENGPCDLQVFDLAGNSTVRKFAVNWFNDVLSIGAIADAPQLLPVQLSFVDTDGAAVSTTELLTEAPYLKSSYVLAAGESSSAALFADGSFAGGTLSKLPGERWLTKWNGYYEVRVDRKNGSWARVVVPLRNMDEDAIYENDHAPFDGNGSPTDPYLIHSIISWRLLRDYVNTGHSTEGMYFLQTADLEIGLDDMIGIEEIDAWTPTVTAPSSAELPAADTPAERGSGIQNPVGEVEIFRSGTHAIKLKGWCYDPDKPDVSLQMRLEIGDLTYTFMANKERADIDSQYQIGKYHGFEEVIQIDLVGEYWTRISAQSVNEEGQTTSWVTINATHRMIYDTGVFSGHYDGGGHTLTFNAETDEQRWAPFRYIDGATIRGLHVTGSITSTTQRLAGLVGENSGTSTITDCRVSAALSGSNLIGGFCIGTGDTLSITGCVFDGQISGGPEQSGCFVAWGTSGLTITDSLAAPQNGSAFTGGTFYYQGSGAPTLQNCYYLTAIGSGQGKHACSVRPGENVSLNFGNGTGYSVSGITAYPCGMIYDGVFRAGVNDAVQLIPEFTGTRAGCMTYTFTATNGALTRDASGYSLVLADADAIINVEYRFRLQGGGTESNPYLIGSRADWNALRDYVSAGYQTSYVYFLQTADITITGDDMIGSAATPFEGIYDGGGHTLTLNVTDAPEYCAPFRYISSATIRNLRTAGMITTNKRYAAGLAAFARYYCTVENCRSSVDIISGIGGKGFHGGFIASYRQGSIELIGCVYDGRIQGSDTSESSGFVGYAWLCNLDYTDCLMAAERFDCIDSGNFLSTRENCNIRFLGSCYHLDVTGTRMEQGDKRGWKIRPGENVNLDFGEGKLYSVSGITVYPAGIQYEGCFYAGEGDAVNLRLVYTGDTSQDFCGLAADAGALTEGEGGSYTLTMPGQDVTISGVGHTWSSPSYEWSEDYRTVTATARCQRDETHVLEETVQTTFILTKPSTFETTGTGYYAARFENAVFTEQRMDVIVPAAACAGGDACPSISFTDMPPVTSYMHIPIDWAVLNQITFGVSATRFGPEESCTRAQFVTFLWRVKGQPEPTAENNPFTDVKPSAYYYNAVLWAVENGVTAGTSKTTFSPSSKVTRAQVVTFLWRFEGEPETASENPFGDVKPADYYYQAVLWAVEKGVTAGTSSTTFSPKDNCTRAQCVTFLYREFGK